MCSIVIYKDHKNPVWPTIIGHIRDENVERAWQSPGRHWLDKSHIVAGLDLKGGGSWLGLNDNGIFVSIINGIDESVISNGTGLSRGSIVIDTLANKDITSARNFLYDNREKLLEYNDFVLVVADYKEAFCCIKRNGIIAFENIPDGLSIVTGYGLNSSNCPRYKKFSDRFKSAAAYVDVTSNNWNAWIGILSERNATDNIFDGMSVNKDKTGFGTSSSGLLALAQNPRNNVFKFCQGYPDPKSYSYTRLIESLDRNQHFPDISTLELFDYQVYKHPTDIAVVFEGVSLTYQELNNWANTLANNLRYIIKQNDVVMVSLDKSLELITAIIAIWKLGAIYTPIVKDYSMEVIRSIQEETKPKCLIYDSINWDSIKKEIHLISFEEIKSLIIKGNERLTINAFDQVSPDAPAFIAYSSGSTGDLKGVVTSHRPMCNRALWRMDTQAFDGKSLISGANLICLARNSIRWVSSIWEILLPLLSGGKLILADSKQENDVRYLMRIIAKEKVTYFVSPPSILYEFLNQYNAETCPSVQHVVCAGEDLGKEIIIRFYDCFPDANLYNGYGATEAPAGISFNVCGKKNVSSGQLGYPIANSKLFILDPLTLAELPVEEIGEMYVGGTVTSISYVAKPELTQAKFIQHPSLGRLYKTGDMGYRSSQDFYYYSSRYDDAILIDGKYINMVRILDHIKQYPAVNQAYPVNVQGKLVIFIVYNSSIDPSEYEKQTKSLMATLPKEVRQLIKGFFPIDGFPIAENTNRKIDRKKLINIATSNDAGIYKCFSDISVHPYDNTFFSRGEFEQKRLRGLNNAYNPNSSKILEEFLKEDSSVLEIGTGPGHLAKWICSKIAKGSYYALDINQGFLEKLKSEIPQAVTINASVTDISSIESLAGKKFDVIYIRWVLA